MSNRHVVAFVFVGVLVLLTTSAASKAADAHDAAFGGRSPRLSACALDGVKRETRCATFAVAENPARANGRSIGIRVAVIAANESPVQRDPIVFFSGGPGESAIDSAADVGVDLAARFPDRDVLLIDQRGTGRSASIACPMFSAAHPEASVKDLFPPAATARCLRTLRARADLTQYSFARFADDVDRIRRELGYSRLNLYALSYGTRAAQVYARAYPDSVRTIYLGSVVPIDIAMPLPFAQSAHDVLGKTLDACESDAACRAAFPALRKEKDAVFAQLAAGTLRAPVGERQVVTPIAAGRIAERLRSMTYRPAGAAAVPWALHRAFLGDWRPLTDGIADAARAVDADMSQGVFFSITCNEDVRFIGEADIAPAVRGTELGDYRVRQQQAACAQWPTSDLPRGYREAVRSDAPTLFVSGDLDPATPLSFTAHAAQGFPHRAELVMRGSGHTEWNECVARAYVQLVRSASVDGLDTNCEPTPRPPFKTAP